MRLRSIGAFANILLALAITFLLAQDARAQGDDAAPDDGDHPGSGQRTAGWVIGGLVVAALLVGVFTGIGVLGEKGTRDENCDENLKVCNQDGIDATLNCSTGICNVSCSADSACGGAVVNCGVEVCTASCAAGGDQPMVACGASCECTSC